MRVLASDVGAGRRVAEHLLTAAAAVESDEPTGVLVVGNGSAKRTPKAPGHFDERAEVFDDDLRRALLEPLPSALSGLDQALAEELWADVAGIKMLGDLLTPAHTAEVTYDDAPFGVQYWVIRWS